MNYMRKILSSSSSQGGSSPTGDDDATRPSGGAAGDGTAAGSSEAAVATRLTAAKPAAPPFDPLSLTHLRKLHAEYVSPPHPLAEQEKDERLYNMLPLFCKVFANCETPIVCEKFSDAPALAQSCSRLLVAEVRRRASNQSTEEAAAAIATFMQVNDTSEESSSGWMLLTALNILCAQGDSMVEVMTSASVPSTLVKCLYLFFDLPPAVADGEAEESQTAAASASAAAAAAAAAKTASSVRGTKSERRQWLQKLLVRLLVRLCGHVPAVEELARKDDLTLLFSAVTSSCPKHNIVWRKTAADILLTVSRHSLSQPVISYLHST